MIVHVFQVCIDSITQNISFNMLFPLNMTFHYVHMYGYSPFRCYSFHPMNLLLITSSVFWFFSLKKNFGGVPHMWNLNPASPGIKLVSPGLKVQSLNCWTARKSPSVPDWWTLVSTFFLCHYFSSFNVETLRCF